MSAMGQTCDGVIDEVVDPIGPFKYQICNFNLARGLLSI
jgi:hypothetical protein